MSEDRPPKLGKPVTGDQKRKISRKFSKPKNNIRKKLDSLDLKKKGADITSKFASLKSTSKEKKDGPAKLQKAKKETKKSRSEILKTNPSQIFRETPIIMIISLIVLIIVVVTVLMWPVDDLTSQNQTHNTNSPVKLQKNHFSDGMISLDYPEGWNITGKGDDTKSRSRLLVTVSKDENNSVSIFREELGTHNFTHRVAAWRSNILKNGMIYYEGSITVDNQTAYEFMANYKPSDKVYATRGIALQKNNILYFIIFIFDDPLVEYSAEMDKVIKSFKVTENPYLV
ncbi:MAG: PsbP-related protein [Euryarchaeota archaeon]|uniref:PsbP-related protein n=1 Tax=Methanobacterium sp. MZD130B TaxID=3394378 RepID=UPI0017527A16|nr:PsbP-related protein [Euryarchaeota archaeon]HHT18970.1 hypothetical protein [Methanobacterium sp.]